jgi:hypothetical protein
MCFAPEAGGRGAGAELGKRCNFALADRIYSAVNVLAPQTTSGVIGGYKFALVGGSPAGGTKNLVPEDSPDEV